LIFFTDMHAEQQSIYSINIWKIQSTQLKCKDAQPSLLVTTSLLLVQKSGRKRHVLMTGGSIKEASINYGWWEKQTNRYIDHLPNSRNYKNKKEKIVRMSCYYTAKFQHHVDYLQKTTQGSHINFHSPTQLQICMDTNYDTRQLFTLDKCRSCLLPQIGIRSNCTGQWKWNSTFILWQWGFGINWGVGSSED
jgi:hypothetical protein